MTVVGSKADFDKMAGGSTLSELETKTNAYIKDRNLKCAGSYFYTDGACWKINWSKDKGKLKGSVTLVGANLDLITST